MMLTRYIERQTDTGQTDSQDSLCVSVCLALFIPDFVVLLNSECSRPTHTQHPLQGFGDGMDGDMIGGFIIAEPTMKVSYALSMATRLTHKEPKHPQTVKVESLHWMTTMVNMEM